MPNPYSGTANTPIEQARANYLGPKWGSFFDSLQGQRVNVSSFGNATMPATTSRRGGAAPISSLRAADRGANYDDPAAFDATDYQRKRAAYLRELDDDDWNRIDRMRANDPGIQLYDEQRVREKAAKDAEATDTMAADSFARMEPTRRMADWENEGRARRMLPYNPAVIQSEYKREGVLDTNDARRDAATSAATGRTGAAAINSLQRAAGTQTFGDPAAEARVGGAIEAIRPNVPGQTAATGAKPFPDEAWPDLLQRFGGDARAADAWLRQHGYARGGG
jgi:hypothetical protein